jgi:ParB-like chromosome segregation protein Spo0J
MRQDELDELAEDIRLNGQREPILTYEDKIIDGRNRFLACGKAEVKPKFQVWNGSGSLVAAVISLNVERRHLTTAEKAVAAVVAEPMFHSHPGVNAVSAWLWLEGGLGRTVRQRPGCRGHNHND